MTAEPASYPVRLPSKIKTVRKNSFSRTSFQNGSQLPLEFNANTPFTAPVKKICSIGAGYVGGPTCAVIANRVPDAQLIVCDLDEHRISAWNSETLPIYEPGLEDIVRIARDGSDNHPKNLFFSTDIERAIEESELIFISVNTPTKKFGLGAGKATDLAYVEAATRTIARVARTPKIIVEKSTVPCRTAETIRDVLSENSSVTFEVLSNPEFLAEGTAITNLNNPDRVLIGSLSTASGLRASQVLHDLFARWIPSSRIISINLWSSELAKLAANALLAQRISSINSLSAICEATGASISEISHAVELDKRIGPGMLKASIGFGGSCFKKDVLSLVYLAESLNLQEVADYWRSVIEINEWQKQRFVKQIISRLNNTLTGKRVAMLGFSYKKNTSDTRESAAILVASEFVQEGAEIAIYDPQVSQQVIYRDLFLATGDTKSVENQVSVCASVYEATKNAHAVVVLTEWDEFCMEQSSSNSSGLLREDGHHVDWSYIATQMKRPMFVFDGRNVLNSKKLRNLGFRVESIGKGSTKLGV